MARIDDGFKRACIYFFYDGQGIVDDYIPYLLDDLMENVDELVVVCNGKLTDDGRNKFARYGKVIERANEGLDVYAYKAGIEYFGWDRLETFDELIMLNHTIFGPFYPFSETFEKMKNRDLDFWGITKHAKLDYDPFGLNPYGYLPEHIQSHFMVYRKRMICKKEFQEYWDNFRPVNNYRDSVCYHESFFTKHFADLGYKWDVSVDVSDMEGMSDYPGLYCARQLVEEKRCPIFKRRSFFHDYGQLLETTAGQPVYEIFKYVQENTDYDTELIWQNILRSMDHSDLARNMQLNYTLASDYAKKPLDEEFFAKSRVALMMHIYYVDELAGKMMNYVRNIPPQMDIHVTTQNEEKKAEIEKLLSVLPNKVTVRIVENKGRDVSALLMTGRQLVDEYDYICFIHDKKVTQEKPGTVGEGFAYNCYKNALNSKEYVNNMLRLFDENPHLGVACPPKPIHGPYVFGLMTSWKVNFQNTKDLLARLGVKAPIDEMKVPVAPHGSCFWFRTDALRKLFKYDWKYEDFPEEPLPIDGTISHAIERCYAYVAQDAGYYSAIVMCDEYAKIEYTTLMHYASKFGNSALMGMLGSVNGKQINYHGWDNRIKYWMRKWMPKKLFVAIINTKRRFLGPHETYRYEDN